jgi:ADP-heptose:LPS heptosyltransferase
MIPESSMRTTPAVRLHFSSLLPFGLEQDTALEHTGINLSVEQWRRGEELVGRLRGEQHSGLVGVNISAGKPNRDWGTEKYRNLIKELSARYPELQVIVLAAPSEYGRARSIADSGGENVSLIPPGLSLLDVTSMIKHLDLMMSPDTSICHIASALEIPLLGLYTAAEENFQRWQPWVSPSWVLRPASEDNLEGISVDDYLSKAEEALSTVFQIARTE